MHEKQGDHDLDSKPAPSGSRTAAAYFTAAVLGVALVLAAMSAIGGGEDPERRSAAGSSAIEPRSGDPNGAAPDERKGATIAAASDLGLEEAAAAAGCELRTGLAEEGSEHLAPGAEAPAYRTLPASSGDHSLTPQADGAYRGSPPEVNVVHSLEHGRVALHYRPSLGADEQLQLKGLFDESPAGMVLGPHAGIEGAVAASAWTQLLLCAEYRGERTLQALRAFRDTYRGEGPESVPIEF